VPPELSNADIATAPAGVDLALFDRMLSVGGAELVASLAMQLLADFERIWLDLHDQEPGRQRAATHELKGVAATIGATDLVDLAILHEVSLHTPSRSDLDWQRQAMRERITAVCALLRSRAGAAATT